MVNRTSNRRCITMNLASDNHCVMTNLASQRLSVMMNLASGNHCVTTNLVSQKLRVMMNLACRIIVSWRTLPVRNFVSRWTFSLTFIFSSNLTSHNRVMMNLASYEPYVMTNFAIYNRCYDEPCKPETLFHDKPCHLQSLLWWTLPAAISLW